MLNKIKKFVKDEQGSGIVEFVMIAAIVIAAIIGVTKFVMPALNSKGEEMAGEISGAGN